MKIRKAKKEDISQLIELMQNADNRTREWAEERIRRYIENKNKMILIAEEDGNLIGFAGLKKYEDNSARDFTDLDKFAWITWIAVLPSYRNKKVGSELLKSAKKYANDYNKTGLILDCREKVIDFYKKNGFNIVGNYINKEIPRYVMVKEFK